MGNVKIVPTEGAEETMEIIAKAITDISEGINRLLSTPLKKDTIILLIHNACGGKIGKRDIETIIDVLPDLEKKYLKTKTK